MRSSREPRRDAGGPLRAPALAAEVLERSLRVVKDNEMNYNSATGPTEETILSLIERRREIIRQTESQGRVDVVALARQFEVSAVTIRNDLNALNAKGLVVRSRGGAVASTRLTRELSMQEKYRENLSVKRSLGRAVAGLIDEDVRSLVLDSGTTMEEVASCLLGRSDLTIMTNGLNIALALAPADGIEVLVTGGTLRKRSMSFYGRQAEESLGFLHFDKLILGADGVDLKAGVTTHFAQEASLNRAMCKAVGEVILVTDSSKFGKSGPHIICGPADIDRLVTDAGVPDGFVAALSAEGVDVHVVSDAR